MTLTPEVGATESYYGADVNSKNTVNSAVFTYVLYTPQAVPGTGQTLECGLNE